MKFSTLWLREWINIAMNSEALSNQITMAGLEVNNVSPIAGEFHGVVVGEVVECFQDSKADKLWFTKVNIGNERLLDILCDAPNCRQGLKVPVATIGAVLPGHCKMQVDNQGYVLSEGILCSFSDLGIADEHVGIIELPEDAPIGTDIRDYLKLDDNTIEISVTANRADCLSIIGVARDVAALNRTELLVPDIVPVPPTISDTIPIQVEAVSACPRYLGRVVKGINKKSLTPLWMKEKLRRCGLRSIDAVVDVINYVLLELGQPMYAFDKDRIDGGIIVRMAKDRETLILLGGREIKLNTDTLVISDQSQALAISGILGGQYSRVNDETQNLLLECAFFNPVFMTGRARRYGLHTEASHRYERGVDPALQYRAMEHATRLLIDICGGAAGPVIDVTNKATLPKCSSITLRRSRLNRLIGHYIDDAQVSDILRRLGCNVTEVQDQWQIVAPSWRFDVEIEEDLVEEVARVYGYNKIPDEPVQTGLVVGGHREADLSLKRVKTLLNDKGYQEVITYSFVDPKVQQLIHPGECALILPSPISSTMSAMRLSLLTGLLKTIVYNQRRQQSRVRIFETGLSFIPDTKDNLGVRQDVMLAGAICGNRYEEHWGLAKSGVDFYDMKGDLESILDLTGKLYEIEFRAEAIPALHPGQSAAIYLKGERIGFIGVVHPELEHTLDLNSRTIVFEMEWNKVADRVVPQVQEVSRFPANRRDIAIVVAESVPAANILAECKKVGVSQLVGVNLFDVYRGKGVAEGFKSLAITLILQDTDRTLTEEEITATVAKCVAALKERFQASLRD